VVIFYANKNMKTVKIVAGLRNQNERQDGYRFVKLRQKIANG
jgi:hypothetical protein